MTDEEKYWQNQFIGESNLMEGDSIAGRPCSIIKGCCCSQGEQCLRWREAGVPPWKETESGWFFQTYSEKTGGHSLRVSECPYCKEPLPPMPRQKTTEALRKLWSMPTFERARDERVSVPPRPQDYTDEKQREELYDLIGDLKLEGVILDYGCGVGRVTRALLNEGCHVIAVDVSSEMLDYCRQYCSGHKNFDRLQTVLTDGFGCPDIPIGICAGALSLYCFQHMPSMDVVDASLKDMFRAINLGGWILIQSVYSGFIPDGKFIGVQITAKEMAEKLIAIGAADVGIEELEMGGYIVRGRKP